MNASLSAATGRTSKAPAGGAKKGKDGKCDKCKRLRAIILQRDADIETLNKNFQVFEDRVHILEAFSTFQGIRFNELVNKKSMTFEARKDLAGFLSLEWTKDEDALLPRAQ